jgi:hypothetical protein
MKQLIIDNGQLTVDNGQLTVDNRLFSRLTSQFSIFNFQFSIFLLLFFLSSCRPKPDVSIKIDRLEQTLFAIPADSIPAAVPQLRERYGELLDLYSARVLGIGQPTDAGYPTALTHFRTDSHINLAYRRVQEVFPDLHTLENGLSAAFSNYHKAFPERAVPLVYTLLSGFNQQIITADTILAIALDNYLGKDEEMYMRLERAVYQRQTMDAKYLLPDCMKAWLYTEFPLAEANSNVLANILYEGKIMYATQQLIPEIRDSLIFGYTPAQLDWCRNNTAQMWTFLVEKKMLYATDALTVRKLIGPAPFTTLFTRESPGRAAVWLGYQIVAAYMKNNRASLEELLQNTNYQQILAQAKFRP